jgi:hypothetical protein
MPKSWSEDLEEDVRRSVCAWSFTQGCGVFFFLRIMVASLCLMAVSIATIPSWISGCLCCLLPNGYQNKREISRFIGATKLLAYAIVTAVYSQQTSNMHCRIAFATISHGIHLREADWIFIRVSVWVMTIVLPSISYTGTSIILKRTMSQ